MDRRVDQRGRHLWVADDRDHAVERHHDAFPDDAILSATERPESYAIDDFFDADALETDTELKEPSVQASRKFAGVLRRPRRRAGPGPAGPAARHHPRHRVRLAGHHRQHLCRDPWRCIDLGYALRDAD